MSHKNLLQLLEASAKTYQDLDCYVVRQGEQWVCWSWAEVRQKVMALSAGLQGLGVVRGDRVSILSSTRAEWSLCDLAILSLGAITVPVYHSNIPKEVEFILANSEAKGVFVENAEQLAKVQQVIERLPQLQFIVVMEGGEGKSGTLQMDRLLTTNVSKATAYSQNLEVLDEETIASFVYTSGTTGQPKGSILTHGNFLAEIDACTDVLRVDPQDVSLSFLPLAHILARVIQFYQLATGFTNAYAESIEKLAENIQEVRPDFLVSVPRIFEKVYERILSQVHASSPIKQKLFSWAQSVGSAYSQAKQKKEPPPVSVSAQYLLASRLVFKKIRDRLGGRMRFAISGGAPLAKEIAEFFHAAGIDILEGYGLTETTGAINIVRPDSIQFGVVGPPAKGVTEKIADDGEVLVKGKMIFKGYFKNDEATREVLDPEGWFHTGDIGEFTSDGSLKITDRKKDIIVTAGGKNIAPQKIENMLKINKYISQVVVHGDKRKFLTALVTVNKEEIEKYRGEQKSSNNGNSVARDPKVYELIKGIIEENNNSLATYESIKKFAILDEDLSQEAGELTPTLKVRRRFVSEKYANVLNKLYQESGK